MRSNGFIYIVRCGLAGLTGISWLVLSNHCALASLGNARPQAAQESACPMHAHKPASSSQGKAPSNEIQICCRNVAATTAKIFSTKIRPPSLPLLAVLPLDVIAEASGVNASTVLCLDTGPPGVESFSELVLQRSLRAHAPPSLV